MKLGDLSKNDTFVLFLNNNIRAKDRIAQKFTLVELDGNTGVCALLGGPNDGMRCRMSTNLEVRRV